MAGAIATLIIFLVLPLAIVIGWPRRHHLLCRLRWNTYRRMLWDEMSEVLGREEKP